MTLQALAPERAPRRAATDKIDARILRVLQRDGRISNLKLAEEVHLSPTAVIERVKRLQRDGYILGYRARLNPEKLGMGLVAFVEVLLDRTAADVMQRFVTAVQARPEILECHLIAGGFDYLLKLRVAQSTHDVRDLVAAVVGTLPGVRELRSYTVMEQVKHGTPLVG
jgi:Lrp/AsnC family leucine-responsive transcriptional regulator